MTKDQMTWTEFLDMFNKKHNPNYYYGKEKKNKQTSKKKKPYYSHRSKRFTKQS